MWWQVYPSGLDITNASEPQQLVWDFYLDLSELRCQWALNFASLAGHL